ncbi:MAG TPA: MIP/aquaporin family protein [Microbacterium sp.]|uniref:MIP/aquaporin family protein n=1 Tax=Microbacterium sp. TaxID=51671 RepID=UPI002C706BA9|nr:MIP/aquaporin family protein [Microbacterium sp.]HWI30684.1 MIP/aquaporin family protein [Microbacterium sp.]
MSAGVRAAVGEFLGSAGLAAVVVGSGIAAERLSPGDVGLELFENAFATALGLAVLILVFAPVSGAHFNPVVTLVDIVLHRRKWSVAASYLPAQVLGCIAGAILGNLMFAAPAVAWSTTDRSGWHLLLAEVVATAGLILVIFALVRTGRSHLAAPAVGAYIGAAYFFTSSTSFANPAITVGRMFTDTFAGIAPTSALPFIAAQLVGAALGWALARVLFPVGAPAPAAPRAEPLTASPQESSTSR